MRRTFIILNGARRNWSSNGGLSEHLRAIVRDAGQEVRLEVSRTPQEGIELLSHAREWEATGVWVGGGDGTAHILVNAAYNDHFAIGVLPMGTVNAMARCLGLPLDPVAAARMLVAATPRPFRPLQIGNRVALCFVSAGFDARVVHSVAAVGGLKRWIGKYAYVVAALRDMALRPRVPVLRLSPDLHTPDAEERFRGVLISRILNYAGFPLFPAMASIGGQMQWHGLNSGSTLDLLRLVLDNSLGRASQPRLATHLEIMAADPAQSLHFQADGEAINLPPGPVEVNVADRPVQLLAPPSKTYGLAFDPN